MKNVTREITIKITDVYKDVPDDALYNEDPIQYQKFADKLKNELDVDDVCVAEVKFFEEDV